MNISKPIQDIRKETKPTAEEGDGTLRGMAETDAGKPRIGRKCIT